ncbi:MAG: zinc ABC transporter substrate-binding protein [Desulfobacteraceae bacterium]|nr:zinc ABC transporter substrate-binding protein [Desulfobacteraceae bacterium]
MKKLIIALAAAVAAVGIYLIVRSGGPQKAVKTNTPPAIGIRVVAAENFYGDIARQLAGGAATVKSLISNPNIDPHEYESTVQDGIAVAKADIVIENGLAYDTWMDKLLSASPNPDRIVITAGKIAPEPLPGNPHVWYGIENIEAVSRAIASALEKKDPAGGEAFRGNLARFNGSLAPIRAKIDEIRSRYAGTPVGLTETVYLYQTRSMGLRVLTPLAFERAIAEGNEPAAADVAAANDQIVRKAIRILIYNRQTVTPITANLLAAAKARGIPEVPVTETMPAGKTYQSWMIGELNAIEKALAAASGH